MGYILKMWLMTVAMITPLFLISQTVRDFHIATIVYLDSIVVKATQTGFSVEDFIGMVRNDETFYHAFRNLRTASYLMTTDMEFKARRSKHPVYYQAMHRQLYKYPCRELKLLKEDEGKRFRRRNGRSRYYTSELYHRLFAREGVFCDSLRGDQPVENLAEEKGHIGELKRLLFSPGESSHIPFVGRKTAIFSDRMVNFYDFEIRAKPWKGNRQAFVFTAKVKPEYVNRKQNQTVIKQLSTYFDQESGQVLCREYHLWQSNALFDFDVRMEIILTRKGDRYFPENINYLGDWNIPTKRRETGRFSIDFSEFE